MTHWAEDPTFGAGSKAGLPTKVEPDSAAIAQGFVPGPGTFHAGHVNWLLNQLSNAAGDYGDGSDGALAAGAGTTTLVGDAYYTDVDLNATDVIETNGYRLFVNGVLTTAAGAEIRHNGGDASGATAGAIASFGSLRGSGAGGAGGTSANGTTAATLDDILGGAGGAGGDAASAYTGGAGGPFTGVSLLDEGLRHLATALGYVTSRQNGTTFIGGGSGGGGGAGDPSDGDAGGGGGGGGGVVVVWARVMVHDGVISATGGAGGDPAFGASDDGGGGGGGGGGCVYLVTRSYSGSGTIDVSGGAAGATGDGATAAVAGADGTVIQLTA